MVIVTLLLTLTKVSQVTTCLNRNVVRSIALLLSVISGGCVVIVTLLLTSTKVSQVTTCLNHNVVRSIAMSAGVELLLDGDLICLNVYKYSSFVALNAKSVGLYPGDS